ncbi:MAG: hypothetical protein ACI3ZL_00425 [Candidatus Cryptobacteroides sp.]
MNRTIKYFLASVAAVAALASCTTEEYQPGAVPEGAQVYISNDTPSSIVINSEMSSVDIPVLRIDDAEDATFTVSVRDTNLVFFAAEDTEIPVAFTAGQKSAAVTIPLDWNVLEDGSKYSIVLTIQDEGMRTPYGLFTKEFILTVPEPYVLWGMATLHEDLVTTFFKVEAGNAWECEVYENTKYPGLLFFKNAFTSEYPYNDPGDYVTEDKYFVVNVADPEKVYVPYQGLGFDWGYGEFRVASLLSDYFGVSSDAWGTLKDGVITFPVKGILISMADYNEGAFYSSNGSGQFIIHLPGAILTDYSVEAEYAGMYVNADNEALPVINFAAGVDVASINYIVIPQTEDYMAAYQKILDGDESVESVEVADSKATILPEVEPGLYYIVYCPVDAEGNLQTDDADILDFYFPGVNAAKPEVEASVTLTYFDEVYGEEAAAANGCSRYNSVAYVLSGKDIKTGKVLLASKATFDYYLAQGVSLEALCNEYGTVLSDDKLASLAQYGYCFGGASGLNAETAYMVVANLENIYGSTACLDATFTTDAIPYSGELVIGEYSDFTLTYAGEENMFFVNNLLLNNGSMFYAVYDPSANTLTLDGVEYGYEEDGSIFGGLYGYANAEKTRAYGYFVFSAENISNPEADGSDPLVLNVDPATHQVCSYASYLFVDVYDLSTDEYLGAFAEREVGDVITYGAASSASAAQMSMKKKLVPEKLLDIERPAVTLKASPSNTGINKTAVKEATPVIF